MPAVDAGSDQGMAILRPLDNFGGLIKVRTRTMVVDRDGYSEFSNELFEHAKHFSDFFGFAEMDFRFIADANSNSSRALFSFSSKLTTPIAEACNPASRICLRILLT